MTSLTMRVVVFQDPRGSAYPDQITEAEVRAYLTKVFEAGASHSYINHAISAIKGVYHLPLKALVEAYRSSVPDPCGR